MKKLCELLSFEVSSKEEVLDLCDNSGQVTEQSMFVALNKNSENRISHINEAISRGAKYILQNSENNLDYIKTKDGIWFVFSKNLRKEWAHVVSNFFDNSFKNTVAVTGTNGKTSTVDILRQIWINSGITAASIGTLGIITKEKREKLVNNLTSPECLELNKALHKLSENGVANIAIETTSQGIDQHRVDGVLFNICALTNFSQDHLDYHSTFENYWDAKSKLFLELAPKQSVFVVNSDDAYSQKIYEIARNRRIKYVSYGYTSNEVKIIDVNQSELFQVVKTSFFGKDFSFTIPLQGGFQVYNSICAATIGCFSGLNPEKVIDGLQRLQPISGRLELITKFNDACVYVDYAHTPDALRNAILSLRNHTKNRVVTVFGCGGDRDQKKRILMGEIAESFSDVVIVTDDNPRNEDPIQIRKMILDGCRKAIEIGNRKTAIEFALGMISCGDSLLIAGKGHETHQKIGKEFLEFSDREVILSRAKI